MKFSKILGGKGKRRPDDDMKAQNKGVYLGDIAQVQQENPRNIFNLYVSEYLNLNKDNLLFYLESSRKGINFWKSLLFEEIRRTDLEIGGICQTRKSSISNKEYIIEWNKRSKLSDILKQEITEFLEEMFERLNLQNFFTDINEAQIQGVSTFEIMYGIERGKIWVKDLIYIQNHLLCYDDISNEYKYLAADKADGMQLRLRGWNVMEDRADLTGLTLDNIDKRKILEVHSLDGNAQNGFQNGCIDSLIWGYLWKHYGLTDWSVYIERFATPSIIAKFPPLMGKDDKRMLIEAVQKYGKLFKLLIPQGADITTLGDTTKSQTSDLFKSYTEYWDSKMSIRVLGQTLTTSAGDKGSYALGKVHDAVREDLAILDMMLVKNTMNELIKRVLELNYAGIDKYPVFSFKQEKDIEYKKQRSEIIKNLYQSGYRVKKEDIEEEFDFEVEPVTQTSQTQGYIQKFINEYFDNYEL